MASEFPAHLHHMTVTGLMSKNEVMIKSDLTTEAYQDTYNHLTNAIEAGFDSCIVIGSEVYGTKKISP